MNSPAGSVWIMRQLDNARRQAALSAFADTPLTDPSQHFMLFYIENATNDNRLPSQKEIARCMNLAPATVTATLKLMEKHGLIERSVDSSDMRVNRVSITHSGRLVAARCRERLESLESQMLRGITPDELNVLNNLIARMTDNLTSLTRKEGVSR